MQLKQYSWILVFLFSIVAVFALDECHIADSCSAPYFEVLTISHEYNAHASLTGAGKKLCCNGNNLYTQDTAGSDTTPLLSLSKENNAHVSYNYPGYDHTIHIGSSVGDYSCTVASECQSDFECLLGIRGRKPYIGAVTNAHIGDCNYGELELCCGYSEVIEPPVVSACGNGIVDSDEECDDGNKNHYDECQNDCMLKAYDDPIPPDEIYGEFDLCNGDDRFWYNDLTRTLVYSERGVTLGSVDQTDTSILDEGAAHIANIVYADRYSIAAAIGEDLNPFFELRDFNRVYYSQKGNGYIVGFIEKRYDEQYDSVRSYIGVVFNLGERVCDDIRYAFSDSVYCAETNNYVSAVLYKSIEDGPTGDEPTFWKDLTSKLRLTQTPFIVGSLLTSICENGGCDINKDGTVTQADADAILVCAADPENNFESNTCATCNLKGCDFNGNGIVDVNDERALLQSIPQGYYYPPYDINKDGFMDELDGDIIGECSANVFFETICTGCVNKGCNYNDGEFVDPDDASQIYRLLDQVITIPPPPAPLNPPVFPD